MIRRDTIRFGSLLCGRDGTIRFGVDRGIKLRV